MIYQKTTSSRLRTSVRNAYTLLELILALALSLVVIMAIGMAIQLYLVALTNQQNYIERKTIARGVGEMVANDLRGGIQYKAADYSDLENLVQSQMMMINQAASIDPTTGEPTEGESSETPPVVDEDNVAFRPTMIGDNTSILIDVSRLPRLDEYNPLIANVESPVQTPSDIKSVAYFVSLTDGGADTGVEFAGTAAPGGLYRRAIDRAVASYNGDTGLVANPDEYSRLVAGEVAEIQFRYFDGEEWLNQWDSVESGGFPTAIEIVIVLDPQRTLAGQNYAYSGFNADQMETYRTVVHLPAAEVEE
ncbi:MAG: hypothetical protein AAFN77_10825 [Planctomycetota bacterium]